MVKVMTGGHGKTVRFAHSEVRGRSSSGAIDGTVVSNGKNYVVGAGHHSINEGSNLPTPPDSGDGFVRSRVRAITNMQMTSKVGV